MGRVTGWRLSRQRRDMTEQEQFEQLYNKIVEHLIKDKYIDKQWTPEERQEWIDKMVIKK